MLLGELGFWEYVQANQATIATIVGTVTTALAGAFVYCVRSIWVNVVIPVALYLKDSLESLKKAHENFLSGANEKICVIADAQEDIRDQIGGRFDYHKTAITHTADGLLAHVDGRPDEAKQLAAKAKEAVK